MRLINLNILFFQKIIIILANEKVNEMSKRKVKPIEDEEKEKQIVEINIWIHVWNSNVEFCTIIS